jgi:cytochrome c-type biogenesis protein CcmH
VEPILRNVFGALVLALGLALAATTATAKEAAPTAQDPALEAKLFAIANELRCLVCQNETIAASQADLAVDLRNQVREMLKQGKSQREILDYMTARYGDFVLYRPPVKPATMLLWFGPAAAMVAGVAILWLVLRRRAQRRPEDFEPDEPDEPHLRAEDPRANP